MEKRAVCAVLFPDSSQDGNGIFKRVGSGGEIAPGGKKHLKNLRRRARARKQKFKNTKKNREI